MGSEAGRRRLIEAGSVVALLGVLLVQGLFSIERISLTTDEHTHIPAGFTYWKTRDFRLNPEHPTLAKLVGGLPLQFRDLSTEQSWPVFERAQFDSTTWDQWVFGETFLFTDNQAVHDGTVSAARRAVLVFPVILAICVYLWGRMLFGIAGGLIALVLAAFNPDVLAHGRLVNTDAAMAAFYVACSFAFWLYLRSPSRLKLLAVGVALGLGLASKYSNVLLFPLLGVMALAALIVRPTEQSHATGFLNPAGRGRWVQRFGWMAANGGVVFLVAVFVVWASYLFSEPPTLWLKGYAQIYKNLDASWQAYFLGNFYEDRVWSYFLVTSLLKTPVPLAALSLLGLWALWRNPGRIDPVALTALIAAPVLLFLAATFKAQPIGHRYVLGMYPYFFLIAGAAVWLLPEAGTRRAAIQGVLGVLVGWTAVAGIGAYPFYLAYHNALVGSDLAFLGYLNDSSNDWGQGWREVVRQQKSGELGPVILHVPPEQVNHVGYRGRWIVAPGVDTDELAPGTHLLRANLYHPEWYRQFRQEHFPIIYDHEPDRVLAGSIIVIHVPPPEFPERPVEILHNHESSFPNGGLSQRFYYYEQEGQWVRSGPYEIYYENGQLRERGNYIAGRITGPYETFYETGQKHEEGFMWDGRVHGRARVWGEDGTLWSDDEYLLGQRLPDFDRETGP